MKWYCEKCKKVHQEDEMCPSIAQQLKNNPELLVQATNFINIAGQYHLVTSQTLDVVASKVNGLIGSNLHFEGANQVTRDIQVFNRLNQEAFVRSGHFSTPEKASKYLKAIENDKVRCLDMKLTGSAQEVDWLREKQGELTSIFEKSELLNKNARGVDGVTYNRFTGKEISRTTVKGSINPIKKSSQGIKDIQLALEKGTLTPNDIIYGPEGMAKAAKEAGITNKVVETNNADIIRKSNERLREKIANGQAYTSFTASHVGQQIMKGAIIGATIGITISAIQNYVRYRNNEISISEAFTAIGKDGIKSAVIGGAMGGISLFLPAGPIGVVAGVVIGIYVSSVTENILNEIYGEGGYGAILNSSGYICGMAMNLSDIIDKIKENQVEFDDNLEQVNSIREEIRNNFEEFDKIMEE